MSDASVVRIKVRTESTPDIHVHRFVSSVPLFDDDCSYEFNSPRDAPGSALIEDLFSVEGIVQVRICRDTLTISKTSIEPWIGVAAKLSRIIETHLVAHERILDDATRESKRSEPLRSDAAERIQSLLDSRVNPMLASHGGAAHLRRLDGHDLYIELQGGCQGCAASAATMKFGIEQAIRSAFPQVRRIVDVTDHAAGSRPFFSPG